MADEVLGISGQIDISDIQENMKELINLLDKVGIKTDEISKTFTEKMNKIQSSSSDSASKQKQAMEVFADSVEMAKSKLGELPAKLQDSLSTIESLDKKCQNLHSSMQEMKINSDEFANANKELQSTRKSLDEVSENADEMAKRINEASKDSVGSLSRIDNSSQNLSFSIAKLIGMLGGTYALKSLYNQMVAIRSQFQAADVAIQTMLGSKEKADALLMQVREYAKISPLEFGDITAATKMMVGFNIEAEKVPRYIQAIGDISMGNKQNFNSLTLAFSQMSATGKLMGQDLLQMINAGFNPLTEMANQTGKSVSQLKEEMSKGAISAEMVQEAFIKATSEGGKFFQMSEKGSQTIQGQLSMMQDAIDAAFNEVGQKTEGIIMTSIQTTTKLIENYDKIGRVLEGLVVTYGAYRAAIALTTFAESGHTITMTLLRARILLTQRAQALLNATMLANPYVLAATAIGALIGTYISLGAWTSSTENAQKTFNEQIEKGKEEMDKYNRETEEAIKLAENDKDATGERRKALNLLIERYPSIIKKYIDEKGHLKDILNLKREIAEIDGKKKVDNYQDKSKEYADWANLAKNGTDMQKRQARAEYLRLTGKSGMFSTTEDAYEYFSTLSKSYTNQANKENAKNSVEKFQNTIANWSKSQLNKLAKALERGKNSGKNYVRFSNYKDLKNADISQNDINTLSVYVEGLLSSKDSAVTKTTLEERKKKLQSELDALSKEEAAGKKGQELRSKIRKIEEDLKPYSSSYDTKNQKEYNTDLKQDEDLLKLQRQERLDAEKQTLVALQAERDANIAAISDDAERERQAMIAAHEKRMSEIKQQEKDMLENNIQKAAQEYQKQHQNDKNYRGFFTQGLDKEVSLTKDQMRQINALYDKEASEYSRMLQEKQNADEEYRLQYLEKYGYDYEKRAAIAEKYDKQIVKAASEWQKKTLEEEKKQALLAFDLKQFQESIDWEALFGDLGRYTKKALKEVQKQIRAYMKTDKFKELNPTDKQVIIQGLQRVENASTIGLPFGEYGKALRELRDAKKANERAEAEQEIAKNNPKATDEIRQKAAENAKAAAERLKNAQDNANSSGDKLTDRLTLISSAFTKLGSSANMSLSEVGGAIIGVLQGLEIMGEKAGGIVGAIIGILDAIGQQGLDGFLGNILGNVGNALTGILSSKLSPVGMVGSAFGVKWQADYSKWQEADNRYKELSKIWDSLISKKQEYLNMSWGVEAQQTGEELQRLIELEKEQAILAAKARLDSGASVGSHSIWYRMWKGSYMSDISDNKGAIDSDVNGLAAFIRGGINWQDVNESVVKGLKEAGLGDATFQGMEDMLYMTSDQLLWIKENYTGLWAAMDGTFRGYLEEIIQYGDAAEDSIKAVKEQILNTSLDNVFDSALSSLQKYADGTEDVFDEINQNWQQMINNMLVNSAIGNRLRSEIEAWYEQWYAAYDNDKSLDGQEIANLKQQYNEIIQNAKDEIDALREAGLVRDIDEDSQSATAKAASNITYDQANVIDGRLTAIQICGEQQLTELQVHSKLQERMAVSLDEISMPLHDIDANIETMVGIQTSMNEHLEAISANTKCLPAMAADINKMKKKMENM